MGVSHHAFQQGVDVQGLQFFLFRLAAHVSQRCSEHGVHFVQVAVEVFAKLGIVEHFRAQA